MNPPFDRAACTAAIANGAIIWRKHVVMRLLERGIPQDSVLGCVRNGACIQMYPEDTPFPGALFFAVIENTPLHVVASFDETSQTVYIITAYQPSLEIFEADFTTRKKL
jgi:hypothetical protein